MDRAESPKSVASSRIDDEDFKIVYEYSDDSAAVTTIAKAKKPKRTYKKRKNEDDTDFTIDCDKVVKKQRRKICNKNNTEPGTLVKKVHSRPSRAAAISSRVEVKKSLIADDDEDGDDINDNDDNDADYKTVFKKNPSPWKRRVKTRSTAKNFGEEKSDEKNNFSDVTTRKRKVTSRSRKTTKLNTGIGKLQCEDTGVAIVDGSSQKPAKKTAGKYKRQRVVKNANEPTTESPTTIIVLTAPRELSGYAGDSDDDLTREDDGMQLVEDEEENENEQHGPFILLSQLSSMVAGKGESELKRVVKDAMTTYKKIDKNLPREGVGIQFVENEDENKGEEPFILLSQLSRILDEKDNERQREVKDAIMANKPMTETMRKLLANVKDSDNKIDKNLTGEDYGMQFVEEEEEVEEQEEKEKDDEDVHLAQQLSRRFLVPAEEFTGIIEKDAVPVFSEKFREPVTAAMIALSPIVESVGGNTAAVQQNVAGTSVAAYRVEPSRWSAARTKSTLKETMEELTRIMPSWSLCISGDPPMYVISHVAIDAYGAPVTDKSVVLDKYFRASVYVGQRVQYKYCKRYGSAGEIVDLIRELDTIPI